MSKMNTSFPAAIKQLAVAFNGAAITKKLKNDYCSGVLLTIILANLSGAPTVTVKLQWVDPTDPTKVVDIPGAVTTALNANGTYALSVYPGVTAVANQVASQAVPDNFQIVATPAGSSGAVDVTISAQLIE